MMNQPGNSFIIHHSDFCIPSPTHEERDKEITDMAKLRPLDDRIVVKPSAAEEKTSGGILLPDTAKDKPTAGTVVAAGPGRMLKDGKRAALLVKVEDVVYYGKYAGTEIQVGKDKFVVLREADVLGVKTN
jgi:chaperonin GroES